MGALFSGGERNGFAITFAGQARNVFDSVQDSVIFKAVDRYNLTIKCSRDNFLLQHFNVLC